MPHTQYIGKIHTEILGMAFASFATIEWLKKNCRVYNEDKHKDGGDGNNSGVFSFDSFLNDMNENNNNQQNEANKDDCKPIVNLKEFDLMTIQKIQKNLDILQTKYRQCVNSTQEWTKVVSNIINNSSNFNLNQASQPQNYYNNVDLNGWEYWNWTNIIQWILQLENGRFMKYRDKLKIEMSKVALNGRSLKQIQSADLLMYGVTDFQDQLALINHIDGLTGRKQKPSQPNNLHNLLLLHIMHIIVMIILDQELVLELLKDHKKV